MIDNDIKEFLIRYQDLIKKQDYTKLFNVATFYAPFYKSLLTCINNIKNVLTQAKINWKGVNKKPTNGDELAQAIVKVFIDNDEGTGPFGDQVIIREALGGSNGFAIYIGYQSGQQVLIIHDDMTIIYKANFPELEDDNFKDQVYDFKNFKSFLDFINNEAEMLSPWYETMDDLKKLI